MYENPSAGKFDAPSTAKQQRPTFERPSRLWLLPLAVVPLALIYMIGVPDERLRRRLIAPTLWIALAIARYALGWGKRENHDEDGPGSITR